MFRAAVAAMVATGTGVAGTAGCGSGTAPAGEASQPARTTSQIDPRAQLAAHAAAAKDRRFIAGYALSRPGRKAQAIMVTVATDGNWRADFSGGALGGAVDVALVGRPDGVYQCALAGADDTGCVRVAAPGEPLAEPVDPRVQLAFTDWLDILTDPTVAITVAVTRNVPSASGTCYAVEASTVTLAPAIESSVFCYAQDSTLTAVRAGFGLLTISGAPADPPSTVGLPGPLVSRRALPIAAPPQPSPPARPLASPTASVNGLADLD